MTHISLHRHADSAGQGFEGALNLVVFVLAFRFDAEIHERRIAQALEEMIEHL